MKKIALFTIIGLSVNSCLKNRYDQDQSAVVNYKIETALHSYKLQIISQLPKNNYDY